MEYGTRGCHINNKETLINSSFVIPAKAGIQKFKDLDSGLRRNDELFRPSITAQLEFQRIGIEVGLLGDSGVWIIAEVMFE